MNRLAGRLSGRRARLVAPTLGVLLDGVADLPVEDQAIGDDDDRVEYW